MIGLVVGDGSGLVDGLMVSSVVLVVVFGEVVVVVEVLTVTVVGVSPFDLKYRDKNF